MATESTTERTDATESTTEGTTTDADTNEGRDWTRAKRVVGAMAAIGAVGDALAVPLSSQRSATVTAGLVALGVIAYALQRVTRADAARLKFKLALLAFVVAIVVAVPVGTVLGDATAFVTFPLAAVLYVAFSRRSSGSIRGLATSDTRARTGSN
jgi:uncharacterized membrane protein HdeD (DUF308 family)